MIWIALTLGWAADPAVEADVQAQVRSMLVERLAGVRVDLHVARAELHAWEARSRDGDPVEVALAFGGEALHALVVALRDAEVEAIALSTTYGPKHEMMLGGRRKEAAAREALTAALQRELAVRREAIAVMVAVDGELSQALDRQP
jgi:hypothetical protein